MIARHTVAGALLVALTGAFITAVPSAAQSTGPEHAGFDATAPRDGHYHHGELGEMLMALETSIRCNCGCGLDVHSCQFQMQCGVSPVWSKRMRDALERGESVEAIRAGFVAEYGPTVLMAPPPEGFNLVGYLLPAAAILTAGMLVGLIARGNAQRRAAVAPVEAVDPEREAKLQAALKELDELESPDW